MEERKSWYKRPLIVLSLAVFAAISGKLIMHYLPASAIQSVFNEEVPIKIEVSDKENVVKDVEKFINTRRSMYMSRLMDASEVYEDYCMNNRPIPASAYENGTILEYELAIGEYMSTHSTVSDFIQSDPAAAYMSRNDVEYIARIQKENRNEISNFIDIKEQPCREKNYQRYRNLTFDAFVRKIGSASEARKVLNELSQQDVDNFVSSLYAESIKDIDKVFFEKITKKQKMDIKYPDLNLYVMSNAATKALDAVDFETSSAKDLVIEVMLEACANRASISMEIFEEVGLKDYFGIQLMHIGTMLDNSFKKYAPELR